MTKLLVADLYSDYVTVIDRYLGVSGTKEYRDGYGWGVAWGTPSKAYKAYLAKQEPFEVFHANDEQTIFRIFLEEKPEAILIDASIWASDVPLIERIRRNNEKLAILTTGNSIDEDVFRPTLELGADDYIRKPFGPRQLRARIKRIMEGKA